MPPADRGFRWASSNLLLLICCGCFLLSWGLLKLVVKPPDSRFKFPPRRPQGIEESKYGQALYCY
jgi:hypothetical protein